MSNKDFFKYHEHQFYNLSCNHPVSIHFGIFDGGVQKIKIYLNDRPILGGVIKFGKRGFDAELSYLDFHHCKFSPYELQEWCPGAFGHFTNYFQWLSRLSIYIDYILSKNPNITLPY